MSSFALNAQSEKYKALFLYNFTKYIEWPSSQHGNDFIIGVLGNSAITNELNTYVGKQKVGARNIIIKVFKSVDEIDNCQILFIPSSKSSLIGSVVSKTSGKNTLLVTDRKGLSTSGSGISFIEENDKLKYEINKSNIQRNGLTVNSALVKLGVVTD